MRSGKSCNPREVEEGGDCGAVGTGEDEIDTSGEEEELERDKEGGPGTEGGVICGDVGERESEF